MSIGESTALYLFVFLISCLATDRAEKKLDSNKKRKAVALSVLAVLIPSVLAGVRGDTVGRDVLEYAVRTFEYADSSATFAEMKELSKEPTGYMLLAYLTSRLFHDTGFFLFGSQLLVITPIYISAYKNRENAPMWLTMFAYFCMFYNNSLNLMKQSVSCAFILLCYFYIKEKHYIRAALCFAIGVSFHFSAVFGLVFILLSMFVKRRNDNTSKIILIVVYLLGIMLMKNISMFLIDNALLPEKYTLNIYAVFDLEKDAYLRLVGFNKRVFYDWVYRVLFTAAPIYFLRRVKKDFDENIKIITILGLVFYTYVLFAFRTAYGSRISNYCDYFMIVMVPMLVNAFKRKTFLQKVCSNTAVVVFLGMYWLVLFMICGWSASNFFVFRF